MDMTPVIPKKCEQCDNYIQDKFELCYPCYCRKNNYPLIKKRTYLKVSYENKDDAKRLGANWDKVKKKWYISQYATSENRILLLQKYK